MPKAIAFFPWVTIEEALTVRSLRLLPYARSERPGTQPHAAQAEIDDVLRAYALSKNQLVSLATLVELGDWHLGEDADAACRRKLFRARELIAFAALAERRLFHGHFDYCNFDTYAFVIQLYDPANPGAFSFSTRRRDTIAQHGWNADAFAFLKPLHVQAHARVRFNAGLLAALLQADQDDALPYEAIVEFNRANTDSQYVPTHTEVVLTKSAFEYLFGIGQGVSEFAEALKHIVPVRGAEDAPTGPLEQRWKEERPKAGRPLEAWAREFCDLRGGAAHGQKRGGARFVWSEDAHLAFASILFPLVVKHGLAKNCGYTLDEEDEVALARIEDYLMHDPFASQPETVEEEHQHPWNGVYSHVHSEVIERRVVRELQRKGLI
jgi:hypothetical protein